jgi:hypothetical protein
MRHDLEFLYPPTTRVSWPGVWNVSKIALGKIRISAVENLTGRINKSALASAPSRAET